MTVRTVRIIVLLLWGASHAIAQIAVQRADGRSLDDRIRSAFEDRRHLVGYAFRRLMEPNNYIATGWSSTGTISRTRTMEHMLASAGDPDAHPPEKSRRTGLSDERREKRIAVLIHAGDDDSISIEYQTTDLAFDSSRGSLVWLGNAEINESCDWLMRLCARTTNAVVRERLVRLIGLHQSGTDTEASFLRTILAGSLEHSVRRTAAMSLGEFGSDADLAALASCVRHDASSQVARAAVWALAAQRSDRTTDTLVTFLQQGVSGSLRREVIQAIANQATERVVPILQGVIENDPDAEVRRMAVWSLANLPEGTGVPLLITVARSETSVAVRKAAIHALAQSKDDRATQALIEIARTP